MKENAETRTKRQIKLDYIRTFMPEIIGCRNIHTDQGLLIKAERLLIEGGFYKNDRLIEGRKAAILRLCVEASGVKPKSNMVWSGSRLS